METRKEASFVSKTTDVTADEEDNGSSCGCARKVYRFLDRNFFLVFIALSLALAAIFPEPGAEDGFLHMDITGAWVAVIIIFLLSGLGLRTETLAKVREMALPTLYIQGMSYVVWPLVGYGVSRLTAIFGLPDGLTQGLVILSCLPTTIGMSLILTQNAGGNEGISVVNAALGNFLGVFLTPLLVLFFLGKSAGIDIADTLSKLVIRVVVPLVVGQIGRHIIPGVQKFFSDHKKLFGRFNGLLLVYVIYGGFCGIFSADPAIATWSDVGTTLAVLVVLHLAMLALSFHASALFDGSRANRIAMTYGASEKTLAMGLPMIQIMFAGQENMGLYILPLLIWDPLQFAVASLLMPSTTDWVSAGEEAKDVDEVEFTGVSVGKDSATVAAEKVEV